MYVSIMVIAQSNGINPKEPTKMLLILNRSFETQRLVISNIINVAFKCVC